MIGRLGAGRMTALLVGGAVVVAGAAVASHLLQRQRGLHRQAAMGQALLARPGASGRGRDARVMTFNIKAAHGPERLGQATPAERDRNLRDIAAWIERVDPDVVLLQEVENGFDRNGQIMMYERLRELLHATDAEMSDPQIGTATLTRNGFTIADRADGRGNQQVSEPINGSSVLATPVVAPDDRGGTRFTVVNQHLDTGNHDRFSRKYVAPIYAGTMQAGGDPFPRRMIVAGDFNASTAAVRRITGGAAPLRDAFSAVGIDAGDVWSRATQPTLRGSWFGGIADRDQIHTTGLGPVRGAAVFTPRYATGPHAGRELSDHRPVVVDIEM